MLKNVRVPAAQLGHLIALKLLARDDHERPQDALDLGALAREASPEDLAKTRRAVELIIERGFHRGRDLAAALREFEATHLGG